MSNITTEIYFELLIVAFPKLQKVLSRASEMGLTHIKMEHFAHYTNEQILKKNDREFMRCLAFQEALIDVMPDDLENAFFVSYCESLLLGQYATEMKEKVENMPPKFKKQYEFYANHYYNLGSKPNEINQ